MTTPASTPDKIAKLLAKAEGTDNPQEAETYTHAAERLMIKWGIEEALVRARMNDQTSAETITQQRVTFTDTYSKAFIGFGAAIVHGLGLRCFQGRGQQHDDLRYLYVVGFESDVARAVTLLSSLRLQAMTAMKVWWDTADERQYLRGWRAFKARRQFIMAFGQEAGRRLAATRRETISHMGGHSTELVLRDRSAHVDAWMAEHHGDLRTARGLESTLSGHAAGTRAGARADLGDSSLSGDRTAIDD